MNRKIKLYVKEKKILIDLLKEKLKDSNYDFDTINNLIKRIESNWRL
jgi:ADP-glucose pyrophosphorylase